MLREDLPSWVGLEIRILGVYCNLKKGKKIENRAFRRDKSAALKNYEKFLAWTPPVSPPTF